MIGVKKTKAMHDKLQKQVALKSKEAADRWLATNASSSSTDEARSQMGFQDRLEAIAKNQESNPSEAAWGEFTMKADLILRLWTKTMREEIFNKLKEEKRTLSPADKEAMETFFDPWEIKLFFEHWEKILDLENKYHDIKSVIDSPENPPPHCVLMDPQLNQDKMIFELLEENILYLLDPCVTKRIWIAEAAGDALFFRDLGRSIGGYIKGGPQKRSDFNKIKNFLVELQRLGLVDLTRGDDSEWHFAHSAVKFLIRDIPFLSKNDRLNKPGKFREALEEWFVPSKKKSKQIKYSKPGFGRYRFYDHFTS